MNGDWGAVALGARVVLAIVFVVAAVAKLRDRDRVTAQMEAPSIDDPTLDFVANVILATVTVSTATLPGGVSAPALFTAPLSFNSNQCFGSHVRIFVTGTQGGTGGAQLKAQLSHALAAEKEPA